MTIKIRITTSHKGSYVIGLTGNLDISAAGSLERMYYEIAGEHSKRVLIDMIEVDYIASSGIRFLFDLMRHIKDRSGVVSLFGLKPAVRKVIEIAKAIPLEQIFLTMEDADAYLEHMIAEETKRPTRRDEEI